MTTLDIVGIGALNLDYIARTPAPPDLDVRPGTEQRVDEPVIRALAEALGEVRVDTETGGSAFNTLHALARMQTGLRLGYVGVAGRGVSSVRLFASLGIDRRFVFREDDHLSGMCFAFTDETLLTHEGANRFMPDYLKKHFKDILSYVTDSRMVHVTSFLDPRTPQLLLDLIRAAKQANPELLVSFDPGHVWATSGNPAVRELALMSNYLFLNKAESDALGIQGGQGPMLVVKLPTGVRIGPFFVDQRNPLPPDEIVDGTGAGDVFAAGVLAAVCTGSVNFVVGARLGLALARHKLRHIGSEGHGTFPVIARSFL